MLYEVITLRLVVALGDREQHHVGVLAEGELRRAHEVADVLDEEHSYNFV